MNMWLLALAIFFVLGAVMVAEIRAKPLRRLKAAAKATTDPHHRRGGVRAKSEVCGDAVTPWLGVPGAA